MHQLNKHSYLQSRSCGVDPKVINKSVNRARKGIHYGLYELDYDHYLDRLISAQSAIPLCNIDVTKRPCAFGRWALPKLCMELHSSNFLTRLQAITSLSDLIHDPEKAYEAIRLKIFDRMTDLMIDSVPAMRDRTITTYITLAGLADAKTAIVKNDIFLNNLTIVMSDELLNIRLKAVSCLEILATTWMTADKLVEFGFIERLLTKLLTECDDMIKRYLTILKLLMYGCNGKQIAIDNNGFKIFFKLLESTDLNIIILSINCLQILAETATGKQLALNLDLLSILNRLIHVQDMDVCTIVASAIMFCTINSCGKAIASKLENLPQRLIELAQNYLNSPLQIYCLKALTNLSEHPAIRRQILTNHLEEVWNIQTGKNINVKKHKEIFISVLNWLPSHGN